MTLTPDQIIQTLQTMPEALTQELTGLSEAALRWRRAENVWCLKEVACHLRDHSEILAQRIQRLASEDDPFIPSWDQEVLAQERRYSEAEMAAILPAFAQWRARVVGQLQHLEEADWQRSGRHEEFGPITIQALAIRAVNHDNNHLEQTRAIKAVLPPGLMRAK